MTKNETNPPKHPRFNSLFLNKNNKYIIVPISPITKAPRFAPEITKNTINNNSPSLKTIFFLTKYNKGIKRAKE